MYSTGCPLSGGRSGPPVNEVSVDTGAKTGSGITESSGLCLWQSEKVLERWCMSRILKSC